MPTSGAGEQRSRPRPAAQSLKRWQHWTCPAVAASALLQDRSCDLRQLPARPACLYPLYLHHADGNQTSPGTGAGWSILPTCSAQAKPTLILEMVCLEY